MKTFNFKTVSVVCVILAAVVWMLPTFFDCWPHKKINLGLDLQGGMHLVLEVQNIKAVEVEVDGDTRRCLVPWDGRTGEYTIEVRPGL